MKQQTFTIQVNTMCMCMTMCCRTLSDPIIRDLDSAEAVNLRVHRLP